jgi:hypothetical protein
LWLSHGRGQLGPSLQQKASGQDTDHRDPFRQAGDAPIMRVNRVIPPLDLRQRVGYLSSMRRHMRSLGSLVTLAFALSVFVPFLLCGAGSVTKAEASACCRAMRFKCHKADGDGACCKHQSVAPVPPGITSASQVSPPRPLATVGVLTIAAAGGSLAGQFGDRLFDLFPAHSPPGSIPLFLFHSTFLI